MMGEIGQVTFLEPVDETFRFSNTVEGSVLTRDRHQHKMRNELLCSATVPHAFPFFHFFDKNKACSISVRLPKSGRCRVCIYY